MCFVVCCSYRGGDDDDGCMIVESRSINVYGRGMEMGMRMEKDKERMEEGRDGRV